VTAYAHIICLRARDEALASTDVGDDPATVRSPRDRPPWRTLT
jgi:hypothetical protein